ncbi:MAG: tyrosinase family protein, partial [Pseudomonadota bacterium]
SGQFWNQCQHQSWFFLPWHRGYITAFEAVVGKVVADLGGPLDWALPYWDYSEPLSDNPDARRLPLAFREPTKPDGTRNFLFSRRRLVVNGDFGFPDDVVSLDALDDDNFTNDTPGFSSGFGGPQTGFNPGGGDNGALESTPHNDIHVWIGGSGGFMSNPATAAFDPIFWLHHCNIDRLWEVWRNADQGHVAPPSPLWRTGQTFALHDADGAVFSFTSEEMLDSTSVLHGFQYDGLPPVVEPPIPDEEFVVAAKDPELAGASEAPLELRSAMTATVVKLDQSVALVSGEEAAGAADRRVYLHLEGIKGKGMPGAYRVLLDLPDDNLPPAIVGTLSPFGLEQASDPDGPHSGNGLAVTYEITKLAFALGLTRGDADRLQIRFQRLFDDSEAFGQAPGLEGITSAQQEANIEIGRINLYFD